MNNPALIKTLRIYLSSSDKYNEQNLDEYLISKARKSNLHGATVLKGIMSYGGSSVVHSYSFTRLTETVPTVIEIIDEQEKVDAFYAQISAILSNLSYGCMVYTKNTEIL